VSIAEVIERVKVIDKNCNEFWVDKKDINFAYRISDLKDIIIIEAELKLIKSSFDEVDKRVCKYLENRLLSQEVIHPSAGCIFKNPSNSKYTAGELIELCQLKGRRIGNVCVSEKHANFIINLGDAKAKSVLELIELIKQKVYEKFFIPLELEIKII
jgi:UDP-N-acetylmuramate dehydrogenase